jgi:hypothetical protein
LASTNGVSGLVAVGAIEAEGMPFEVGLSSVVLELFIEELIVADLAKV